MSEVFLQNYRDPTIFWNFLFIFLLEKLVEYVYGSWTGPVVARVMGPWTFIKPQSSNHRWTTQI
jgi:hypothetical protein